jgi:hypothetical protein
MLVGQEFVAIHDLLNQNVLSAGRRSKNAHDVFWKRYGILATTNFPFHLIAWVVDDSNELVLEHIQVHDTFASATKTRMNRSKNEDDKQDV